MTAVLAATRARVFRDKLYSPVPGHVFETLDALDEFFTAEPDDDWTGEDADGTRSILDIRDIATELAPGVTAPLAEDELVALFGTSRPTAPELTAKRESAIYERLTRGDSLYVVVYADGQPVEVVFYGYSWD